MDEPKRPFQLLFIVDENNMTVGCRCVFCIDLGFVNRIVMQSFVISIELKRIIFVFWGTFVTYELIALSYPKKRRPLIQLSVQND